MFKPKYVITNKLLDNIKTINRLIIELNYRHFPQIVLTELERNAREVSAHASTSIEGNPLPLTEVKRILKNKPVNIRDSEKEVLNYNNALQYLNKQIESEKVELSLDLISNVQGLVTTELLPEYDSGKLRQRPVAVNNPKTGQTVYLPPDVTDVRPLMNELIEYINIQKKETDPLLLAGILHKQMVIIHPFMDGNGRTTRLITKVLLATMGLNTFNLFSFEKYYNQNVGKYFQTVGEYGDYYKLVKKIDFTVWLEYFTEGIIDELFRVQKLLPNVSNNPDLELKPYHKKILKFIDKNGFIKDSDYTTLTKRARPTRALDFNKLIELRLIERKNKGKATYYSKPLL